MIMCNRFNDLTAEQEWDKFIQSQRKLGALHVQGLVIRHRFELGLELRPV